MLYVHRIKVLWLTLSFFDTSKSHTNKNKKGETSALKFLPYFFETNRE